MLYAYYCRFRCLQAIVSQCFSGPTGWFIPNPRAIKKGPIEGPLFIWLRGLDLNQRPSGYKFVVNGYSHFS